MSVTSSFPSVSVPVLSKTIVLILYIVSMYSPPLISTPLFVPAVIPETMETGVDMANAHGQDTTSNTNDL